MMGREVPETRDPNIRERFVHKYRVIYKLEPQRVLIAAVIHGSRLLAALGDRLEDA
jgi:plasmid stabilization system protein ParE